MGKKTPSKKKKLFLRRETIAELSLQRVSGGTQLEPTLGCTLGANTCLCPIYTNGCTNMQHCMTLLTVWCCVTIGGAPSNGKGGC